jgi:hypothetical protein
VSPSSDAVSDPATRVIADTCSSAVTTPDWFTSAHPARSVEPTPNMNQPPTPNPPDDGVDVVPGDPPVPITVWRTPASGGTTPIPDRLAYRLLAAYTTPGDTIIDLTHAPSITATAAAGHRNLVHATFTRTHQLTVTATTPAPPNGRRNHPGPTGAEPSELTDWFGDDLQHPDRPTTSREAQAANGPAGPATRSLLVAPWPLHPHVMTNTRRLTSLAATAVRVLHPGGCVVVVAVGDRPGRGDYTHLVEQATTAELRYLQHIVAIGADIDGDHFTYHSTDHDLDDPERARHHRAHADLLVFTTPTIRRSDG